MVLALAGLGPGVAGANGPEPPVEVRMCVCRTPELGEELVDPEGGTHTVVVTRRTPELGEELLQPRTPELGEELLQPRTPELGEELLR